MTLHLRIPALLSALTLTAFSGCSGQPAPTTSTLTGTIAQPSFVSPVTKITVTNDKGQSAVAAVGAHGEFSIKLKKGATYQLFLSDDGKSMPIIMNSDPWPTTTVHVKSGGASLDIGSVRFWPGDLSDRSRTVIVAAATAVVTQECVNGVIAGSTKPCASGAAAMQCADDDDDHDCEHEDGDHNEFEHADESVGQADVEHEDSQSQAIPAHLDQAMGVPAHNVVGDVGCNDDDDDDDGEEADD
jgi:hypothetical protein